MPQVPSAFAASLMRMHLDVFPALSHT